MVDKDGIGVIFDMDGVLIDSADAHLRSWRLLGEENDATISHEQFMRTFGRPNREIIPVLFDEHDGRCVDRLAERKEEIYRDLIREDPPLVDGASALLRELQERGVRIGIGSSGPPANIRLVVEALGAEHLIRAVVSGDDVERGKPDPQVFELSARRLELSPSRCVVIEDAPVGVEAAKAAGALAVAVLLHHGAEKFRAADLIVQRLRDLTADRLMRMVLGRACA
ncbi:MAG: HAD family phosphatase [Phycisphaerae bacterium]|nr:HAD family phosphatase [Phycisphaerae bacterium]